MNMNKIAILAVAFAVLILGSVFGQSQVPAQGFRPQMPDDFQRRLQQSMDNAMQDAANASLTKFNLDFPGGSPFELVAAIQKAMGKPLNVIVKDEDRNITIPALRMSEVTVPQLFEALEAASATLVNVSNFGGYSQRETSYGFRTDDKSVTDTSVWYFQVRKALSPPPNKTCQFYSLSDYLDRGFTVDDITTAIQTGWKISGQTNLPELNYHKETKLLIVCGEPAQLSIIDQVLHALPATPISRAALNDLRRNIQDLQNQVRDLNKSIAALQAAPAKGGEEKSGK